MKKNYYSEKRPKWVGMTLFTVFCCLFANMAMAQDSFTWNGSSPNNSATAGNWTKTGVDGADTFSGQTPGRESDLVVNGNVHYFYLCNKFQIKYK